MLKRNIHIYIYIPIHNMASLTTNTPPSHAKRQRTSLKQSTIEALQEERAEPIEIGILVLPAGFESACGIMTKILLHLDR